MKLLFLGPQGSGKGTVGKIVSKKLDLPILDNGKMLRALPESHPRYKEVNDAMSRGDLVDQSLLASLSLEETKLEKYKNGFIHDGWGRALIDLELYDPVYDYVIVFNLSREDSIKRITGRRICDTDGQVYNIYTLPEEAKKCTGNLIQRADDTEEAVNHRLNIYYTETQKVIDLFKQQGKVIEIDASPMPNEVADELLAKLAKESS